MDLCFRGLTVDHLGLSLSESCLGGVWRGVGSLAGQNLPWASRLAPLDDLSDLSPGMCGLSSLSLLELFFLFLEEEDSECLLSLGGVLGVLGDRLLLVLTDLVLDLDFCLGGEGVGVLLGLGGEQDGDLLLIN